MYFKFGKLTNHWVPCLLTEVHCSNKTVNFLSQYEREELSMLDLTVTGDEIRVHHSTLQCKKARKTWYDPGQPGAKRAEGSIVNADCYIQILDELDEAIRSRRCDLNSRHCQTTHCSEYPGFPRLSEVDSFQSFIIFTRPCTSRSLSIY